MASASAGRRIRPHASRARRARTTAIAPADRRSRLHGARAVRRALPGALLQRRASPSRTWSGWRPAWPRRASCPFVYSIVTFAVAAAVRVHPQRSGRCTSSRCASSASAAASTTGRRARRTTALEDVGRDARAARDDRDRRRPTTPGRARRSARPGTCPGPSTTGSARTTAGRARARRALRRSAAPSVVREGDDVCSSRLGAIAAEAARAADGCSARAASVRGCVGRRERPARRRSTDLAAAARARPASPSPSRRTTSTGGARLAGRRGGRRAGPRLPRRALRRADAAGRRLRAARSTCTGRTGSPRRRWSRRRSDALGPSAR